MSACRRGGPIFILKTAFKNINQAQQNFNLVFCYVFKAEKVTVTITEIRWRVIVIEM